MAELRSGDVLLVLATDPESPLDMAAWAADEGHSLAQSEADGYLEFRLVKA
jgi:TusA-related sulfurtransferase